MLDYIVMQVRKTNREKGYWDRVFLASYLQPVTQWRYASSYANHI